MCIHRYTGGPSPAVPPFSRILRAVSPGAPPVRPHAWGGAPGGAGRGVVFAFVVVFAGACDGRGRWLVRSALLVWQQGLG